jgi:hypothetical protein
MGIRASQCPSRLPAVRAGIAPLLLRSLGGLASFLFDAELALIRVGRIDTGPAAKKGTSRLSDSACE